jgi:hypothetical protein
LLIDTDLINPDCSLSPYGAARDKEVKSGLRDWEATAIDENFFCQL